MVVGEEDPDHGAGGIPHDAGAIRPARRSCRPATWYAEAGVDQERCDTVRHAPQDTAVPTAAGCGRAVRTCQARWYRGTTASVPLLSWVPGFAVPGLLAFLVTKPGRGR
ncbi:hypothetical protein ALMP_57150 [Streptomyces sp. A012304]|nr:hypothetical protein ALMP_57150 [Streptomyces sp. A012304]